MTTPKTMPTKIACMVSVPKCGSHSIRGILALGENRDEDSEEPIECHVIYENHQRLAVLEQKYDLAGKYVFAFVRNPYDRLSSWYQFHSKMEPYRSCTFEQWVISGCPTHWTIQNATDWAAEGLSPLLQNNFLAGEKAVDFIGRMENFPNDIQKVIAGLNAICGQRGIDRRFAYRELKMNRSKPHANHYTAEMKNVVFALFREDFETFGYEV
jgi:hypothetical protein